jgi:hypothetical protein
MLDVKTKLLIFTLLVYIILLGLLLQQKYNYDRRISELQKQQDEQYEKIISTANILCDGLNYRVSNLEEFAMDMGHTERIKSEVLVVLIEDYQQRSGNNMVVISEGNTIRIGVAK